MIRPDPNLMNGHEPQPTKEPAITSGAVIPRVGKIPGMIAEQERRDELRRRSLLRQIQNAQCAESGLFGTQDFGGDETDTL